MALLVLVKHGAQLLLEGLQAPDFLQELDDVNFILKRISRPRKQPLLLTQLEWPTAQNPPEEALREAVMGFLTTNYCLLII